jgi:hypothetical protein
MLGGACGLLPRERQAQRVALVGLPMGDGQLAIAVLIALS